MRNINFLNLLLIFCMALVFISVYFLVFSILIGSDYRQFTNPGDLVNMLSFTFVVTALAVSLFWPGGKKNSNLLSLALVIFAALMMLVISINRYLAVYPESGAWKLFFYVGILDFFAAIVLPIGLGRIVGSARDETQKI